MGRIFSVSFFAWPDPALFSRKQDTQQGTCKNSSVAFVSLVLALTRSLAVAEIQAQHSV